MPRPRPHVRVRIGRGIALIGAALYAASRAVAYWPGFAGNSLSDPVSLITASGHLLWAWSLAWATAAVLCLVDLGQGHTRRGLALIVGLSFTWGIGYGLHWIVTGIGGEWTRDWITMLNYLTITAIVWGLLLKVTALHDMAHPAGMEEEQAGRSDG